MQNYKEASQYLKTYLAERPKDIDAYFLFAKILEEKNKPDQALKTYEKILRLDTGNTQALAAVSRLYQERGKSSQALILADELVNLQGTRGNSADLGELRTSLEMYENVLRQYKTPDGTAVDRNISKLKELLDISGSFEEEIPETIPITEPEPLETAPDEKEEEMMLLFDTDENLDDDEFPEDIFLDEEEPLDKAGSNQSEMEKPYDYEGDLDIFTEEEELEELPDDETIKQKKK